MAELSAEDPAAAASTTADDGRKLMRFRVPGRSVGLVAAGTHFDAHEACLKLRREEQAEAGRGTGDGREGGAAAPAPPAVGDYDDDDDDAEARRVFSAAKPLRTNREWRDAMFGPDHREGRPARLPRRGDAPPFADDSGSGRFVPALSGEWRAGRLQCRTDVERPGDGCGVEGSTVGGAVLWHAGTVGPAAEDAAAAVRDMCMCGHSYYNDKDESEEFVDRMGGRIVQRGHWEGSTAHPINASLPEDSELKFEEDDYNDGDVPWGPVFLFAAADGYLQNAWPDLRRREEYGRETESAVVTVTGNGAGIHTFFKAQEYLAGRMFTTRIEYTREGTNCVGAAVHMLVLHTYSAPEAFDDACIEGIPVGNLPVSVLRDACSLLEWVKGASDEDLRDALGSISPQRSLALLDEGIHRNTTPGADNTPERAAVLRRIIPVLMNEVDRSPSLVSILYLMKDAFSFDIFDAYLDGLRESGVLPRLVVEMKNADKATNWRKLTSSVLLGYCRSVPSAQSLVDAGVVPTDLATRASMDRPDVFSFLFARLTDGLSGLAETAKRWDLIIHAVRGLHWAVLAELLRGVSKGDKDRLASTDDIDVLEPITDPNTGVPGQDDGSGSVGQVALTAYLNCVAYSEMLVASKLEGHQREAFCRTMRVLVAELDISFESCRIPNNHTIFSSLTERFKGCRRGQDLGSILPEKAEAVIALAKASGTGADMDVGRLQFELSQTEHGSTLFRQVDRHWFSRAREEMGILG